MPAKDGGSGASYIIGLMLAGTPKKRSSAAWYWLLVLPLAALLFPGFYSRIRPELFGFPFFYWYQFAWVLITAALTGLVYLLTNERKD